MLARLRSTLENAQAALWTEVRDSHATRARADNRRHSPVLINLHAHCCRRPCRSSSALRSSWRATPCTFSPPWCSFASSATSSPFERGRPPRPLPALRQRSGRTPCCVRLDSACRAVSCVCAHLSYSRGIDSFYGTPWTFKATSLASAGHAVRDCGAPAARPRGGPRRRRGPSRVAGARSQCGLFVSALLKSLLLAGRGGGGPPAAFV